MVDERKSFRKGGKRKLLANPFGYGNELNEDYNIRAKQFCAFAALRGFEDLIEEAQEDAAKENDRFII